MRLPELSGAPIAVEYLAEPHAWRGQLRSGPGPGEEVHAGSFIRRRTIVLDTALRSRPSEHRRILTHELFHFVWVRLGQPDRAVWARLLAAELAARARGDLGWSAELAKGRLHHADQASMHMRWRRYISEAFCDTAAWLFAGLRSHDEFTLARRHRDARRAWFLHLIARRRTLPI
jgi:hypothetical protein